MEGINPNNLESILSFSSVDSLKTEFQKRLNDILYKKLSVENIETFADEALVETIALVDDILHQYQSNPNFEKDSALTGKAAEDDAFHKLDLPDLPAFLDSVVEVKDKIDSLKGYINNNRSTVDKVITPPQPTGGIRPPLNTAEQNQFSDRRFFPRLLTLMYLLEQDFEIPKENVTVTEGLFRPDMIRQTPYVRVDIPDLERLVYICDEEGNVTYVFDTKVLAEVGVSIETVDLEDKGDKNSLIKAHPGIGVRIKQTPNWNQNMTRVLSEPIPEPEVNLETADDKEGGELPRSEFKREREVYLSYEDFQREVKLLYPGKGNVNKWYRVEKGKHKNWPANPDRGYYKKRGWLGWPELVGKENPLKREFLSFEDFQREVNELYPEDGDVFKWYHLEKKKHKNWPADPNEVYRESGWVDWSKLVGKENPLKKEFLFFDDFQREVKGLYPGKGEIYKWYRVEKKKHKNWPAHPYEVYKNSGWLGWLELVGRENRQKK